MSNVLLRIIIAVCCLVGLYVATFMQRKYNQATHGQLLEPSVVTSERAAIAGVPNSRVGLIYYSCMLVLTPWLTPDHMTLVDAGLAASLLAALASAYLAYSLLFITRAVCVYCWVGHIINWALLALLITTRSLSRS